MAREKVSGDIKGARGPEMAYNDWAGGLKTVGPLAGVLKPLGGTDLSTLQKLPQLGAIVAVYNSDTVVHWVALGPQTATAPTGFPAIAVAPNSYTYICMGANQAIICDAAGATKVFGYQVIDESYLSPSTAQGYNPQPNPNPGVPTTIL